MHLIDSVDVLLDPDRIDIPEDAIAQKTLASARDFIAGDVRGGVELTFATGLTCTTRMMTSSTASHLQMPWR
jgi:hypothetical protein